MARINFVELPATDVGANRTFYAKVFGWELTEFGPTYASTMTGDVDLGLQGDRAEATAAPLAVVEVADLAAAEAAIVAAGGRITRAAFSFPGGRRFHFADPHGNELAVMAAEE